MKFIVDENVRQEVVIFLETQGHDVIRPLSGTKDSVIANIAKRTDRIILTHDKHFANIIKYPPRSFPGIIRFRIVPPKAKTLVHALDNFLRTFSAKKLKGRLIILEKNGARIR